MSSLTSTNNQQPNGLWMVIAPFIAPPIAASVAIIPTFRDLAAKSDLQKGQPIRPRSLLEGIKGGVQATPTIGALVGTQMVIQNVLEKYLVGESNSKNLSSMLTSSAIVGILSSPVVAIFNGRTLEWSARRSLGQFTPRQALVISLQETAFVGGLSAADKLSAAMKEKFGNNKVVDYTGAFIAGAAGSLAGHPANTALTRWQSKMSVESLRQLMWGAGRKAWAIGCFSVIYKLGKETLNPDKACK